MTIEAVVARWGVAAVFAGAALEGETAVIAGGVLAHQGLLHWPLSFAAAFAGSFIADQSFFALGRRFRDRAFVQRWTRRAAFAKALELLERHPTGFILAFRFIYGFRLVSPVAIGTSRVPLATFLPLNAIAALVWAGTFTAVGYWFGAAVTQLFGRFAPSGHTVVWSAVALVVLVGAIMLVRRWRR